VRVDVQRRTRLHHCQRSHFKGNEMKLLVFDTH
jgi:hypothetical protein